MVEAYRSFRVLESNCISLFAWFGAAFTSTSFKAHLAYSPSSNLHLYFPHVSMFLFPLIRRSRSKEKLLLLPKPLRNPRLALPIHGTLPSPIYP
jgi:hypothetical protein